MKQDKEKEKKVRERVIEGITEVEVLRDQHDSGGNSGPEARRRESRGVVTDCRDELRMMRAYEDLHQELLSPTFRAHWPCSPGEAGIVEFRAMTNEDQDGCYLLPGPRLGRPFWCAPWSSGTTGVPGSQKPLCDLD